jgi:hypothetical protein
MTSTSPKTTLQYSEKTVKRGEIALSCSPFYLALFEDMQNQSVPLATIANVTGIDRGYTKKNITEARAEAELIWLINVGLLRREVDGQGLTDSFRLTPLGRYILVKWQENPNSQSIPSWYAKISNWLNRRLQLTP